MLTPDPREVRLPKWARTALADLRRRVADEREQAAAARLATDPSASTAVLDPYADVPIGLGRRARVRLLPTTGDAPEHARWVDVSVSRWGDVEVSAGGCLTISPQSGNVVRLRVDRF